MGEFGSYSTDKRRQARVVIVAVSVILVVCLLMTSAVGTVSAKGGGKKSYNLTPIATIESISPNAVVIGTVVYFDGSGVDPGWVDSQGNVLPGNIVAYNWRSSLDGDLSTLQDFSTADLSIGTHIIYFKVLDNMDSWSPEVNELLVVVKEELDLSPGSWEIAEPSTTDSSDLVLLDQNYGTRTYDDEGRGQISLGTNVWSYVKNSPQTYTTIEASCSVLANTRYGMGYGVAAPVTDNLAIFDADHLPPGIIYSESDNAAYPVTIECRYSDIAYVHFFGCWYDFPYNLMWVTTNGLISFDRDAASVGMIGPALPGNLGDSDLPNGLIAPLWRDMKCDASSRLYYGTPANNFVEPGLADVFFAVVWKDVICKADGARNSFAVLFHTIGNDFDDPSMQYISFVYQSVTSVSSSTVAGVEDQSGTLSSIVPTTSISSGKRVNLVPSPNNFYVIRGLQFYAQRLGGNLAENTDRIHIWGDDEVDDRPGGYNIQYYPSDPDDSAYETVGSCLSAAGYTIDGLKVASTALKISIPFLGPAGWAITGAQFAYDLLSLYQPAYDDGYEPETADEIDTAYIKVLASQEEKPFPGLMYGAWDVGFNPRITWTIPEVGIQQAHHMRIWAVVDICQFDDWNSHYSVTSDPVTLTLKPSEVEGGLTWLPRSGLDNGGLELTPTAATIGGTTYDGFKITANSEGTYGYDMMAWQIRNGNSMVDYYTRQDSTIRVEGYFMQQDSAATAPSRSVKAYMLEDEFNFIYPAYDSKVTLLTSADAEDVWHFRSAYLGDPVFGAFDPVKVAIGRPNNWASEVFSAGFAGVQVFANYDWALNVAAETGGTVYGDPGLDNTFGTADDNVLNINRVRDLSWLYTCAPDITGTYGSIETWVYAKPDYGYVFDYWEINGVESEAYTANPMMLTWDGSGDTDYIIKAHFTNTAPYAMFSWNINWMTVTVNGWWSHDPDGTIVGYSWDWGDGSPDGSGATATHTYSVSGSYTVALTVTDDDGFTDTWEAVVTTGEPNQSPYASWTYTLIAPLTVRFDAGLSYDPDGTIVQYKWSFGDGTFGLGKTVTYTYYSEYDFLVRLIVYDDDGATGAHVHTIVFEIDNEPPSCSVTINEGAQYTTSTSVTLTLSASDDVSGLKDVYYSNDGITWVGPEAYSPTRLWVLAPPDGVKTVFFKVMDYAGLTTTVTDTIILDTSPPTATIVINGGAYATSSMTVTLTLTASDAGTGVKEVYYKNDAVGSIWVGPESQASSKTWTLISAEGVRTVYFRVVDNVGLETIVSDTIVLDWTTPTCSSLSINSGAAYCSSTSVSVTVIASDAISGVQYASFSNDGGAWSSWITYSQNMQWTLSATQGTRTVAVRVMDFAGLISSTRTDTIFLDLTNPTASISVNSGATYTTSTAVTLTLAASDSGSGICQVCYSNDGATFTAWEAYTTTKSWTLSSGDGTKIVYYKVSDNSGRMTTVTDTINLDSVGPVTTITLYGEHYRLDYLPPAGVRITATDVGSGVASIWYRIGTVGSFSQFTNDLVFGSLGTYTVYAYAIDLNGNVGATKSVTFRVVAALPE